MKIPKGQNYVEVKDHRYKIHPTKSFILLKRDPPQSLRTQYQVQNNTQIKKNQKVVKKRKNYYLKIILKTNNHIFNNKILNPQIALLANKIFG